MGIQQDPIQVCGYPFPVEFVKMLASTLVKDGDGNILGFNFTVETPPENCGCEPVIDCDNSHIPPENLLVLGFGLDTCGKLAIKLVNCDGTLEGRPE